MWRRRGREYEPQTATTYGDSPTELDGVVRSMTTLCSDRPWLEGETKSLGRDSRGVREPLDEMTRPGTGVRVFIG